MSSGSLEFRLSVPLKAFDLEIEHISKVRVVGLFGASGSGKTTLLESLAGLRRNASGYARLNGDVWLDSASSVFLPPEKRGVGYVPQDHLLFPHRDVRANLASGKNRALRAGVDFKAHFEEVVRVLELNPLLDRSVRGLSGGERQRVALGRALCSGPRILLLDEPLASLDIPLRHRILPYLVRVRDAFAIPIFIASHNPTELQALCEEILVLRDGRIAAAGPPLEVLTRPDIFVGIADEGFENLLSAVVKEHSEHTTAVIVGGEELNLELTIPRTRKPLGARVHIGMHAQDILLATEQPKGLSARNCIPAVVGEIRSVEHRELVSAVLSDDLPPVIAELTRDAVEELDLAPGSRVFIVTKTHSIVLYG